MAKTPKLDEEAFRAMWKALPLSDKRFIGALIALTEVIGDEGLRYHELPAHLERTLQEANRDTLFSIIAECLGLLLNAPAMERVKQCHRRRRRAATARKEKPAGKPKPSAGTRSTTRKRSPR
ncbi:MAG: hypothetical protein PVJ57_12855 [Phycisphaerae bacterium]|jgi:hypothetical protein